MSSRILIIEDDHITGTYIQKGLSTAGHAVDWLRDGRDALAAGLDPGYDVLVVDRMIPGLDGLNLVKGLRAASVRTPVLFLTAIRAESDHVASYPAALK